MADVKWIKITTNIFDDEKIKIIDTMTARDEILVIWFKLLALAGKTNQSGMLFMSNRIAYTPDMLAAVFNRELNVVRLALSTFESFGMIEVEDNQIISIANWEKHQNIDGLEKIRLQNKTRKQLERERKKILQIESKSCDGHVTITQSHAIEEELELEEEKDIKNSSRFTPPTLKDVQEYCKERKNNIDPEHFIDSNEAKGWVVGKNSTKMKDWKAAIRTWERNDNNKSKQSDTNYNSMRWV